MCKRKWLLGCLPALLLAAAALPAGSGAPAKDLIFAGNGLSTLRSAARPPVDLIALKTPQLRRDLRAILGDPPQTDLAALIVPKEADSNRPIVRRVYNDGTTLLTELTVDAADIVELRRHAQDGFIQFVNVAFVTNAPNATTTAELIDRINKSTGVAKQKMSLFAGAILADQGTTNATLAKLTNAYHLATENSLRLMIDKAEKTKDVKPGVPYMFGPHPVTERHLTTLPADSVVKDFHVGSADYKIAWVGSTAVVVKPADGGHPDQFKTGVKGLQLSPDLEKRVLEGGSHPANNLKTLPGKH